MEKVLRQDYPSSLYTSAKESELSLHNQSTDLHQSKRLKLMRSIKLIKRNDEEKKPKVIKVSEYQSMKRLKKAQSSKFSINFPYPKTANFLFSRPCDELIKPYSK